MAEERTYRFSNNVTVTLTADIDDQQVTFEVDDDSLLPALDVDQICTLVLRDDALEKYEIMNVTAHSGNSLDVERGAEDTTPAEWPEGTICQHALTAGFFNKLAAPPASFYRTSRPYPHEVIEALDVSGFAKDESPSATMLPEALDGGGRALSGGVLDVVLVTYTFGLPEALDSGGRALSGGTMAVFLQAYNNYAAEAMDSGGRALSGGDMDQVLQTYENYAPEALDIGGRALSGGTWS